MAGWLGVVSAAHVRRGRELGIAQINHGKRAGLARMAPGDTLVYYSPTEVLGDGTPLRQFTALGAIADEEIWQADDGCFKPFRRRVEYLETQLLPLAQVQSELAMCAEPNWGYRLRWGLVPLTDEDVALLRARMLA